MKANQKLKAIHSVSMECIKKLVIKDNYSVSEAESEVLEILKECSKQIKLGNHKLVIGILEMTFLDISLNKVSKSIIN
jgi:hypothetical protein